MNKSYLSRKAKPTEIKTGTPILSVESVGEIDIDCVRIFTQMFTLFVMVALIARGNYLLSV